MAVKRRKSEVLPAVQSRAEAIDKLQRYAALAAQIEARAGRVAAAVAQMKAEADKLDAPLIEEQQAIFLAIKPWWAVAGATVTEGDRKTAELGGCLLGHRTGNPTLKHPSPVEKAVNLLVERGWKGLLRVKFELDKPAITAALRWLGAPLGTTDAKDEDIDIVAARDWFASAGFRITQTEDFFIDRLPPKGEPVDVVADPAATQAQQVAA
jgi:phage host-nuclease inhibitor protein Gam